MHDTKFVCVYLIVSSRRLEYINNHTGSIRVTSYPPLKSTDYKYLSQTKDLLSESDD